MQERSVESWILKSAPGCGSAHPIGVQLAAPIPVSEPLPEFKKSGKTELMGLFPPGLSSRPAGTVAEVISNTKEPVELPSASALAEKGNHIDTNRHILRLAILDLCVHRYAIYRVLYANMLLSFD